MTSRATQSRPELVEIEALRAFNRFYTQRIGVLGKGLLRTRFSLTQARVLYELGTRGRTTAGEIQSVLGLDLGYLSRILSAFASQKLIKRAPSLTDRRRVLVSLTEKGRRAFRALDQRSRDEVSAMLSDVPAARRLRLLEAVREVGLILGDSPLPEHRDVLIRTHQIGDIGWAIERHARLYSAE